MDTKIIKNSTAEFLIFCAENQIDNVEVVYHENSIWASQKSIAQLFGVDRSVVSKHLKNIFESKELQENSVCANFAHTAADGKTYTSKFYNLDAIISVGYRTNSIRATQFRQWSTSVLRQFALRGYVIDKNRMKNGNSLGQNYFDRLLAEIREIRLSERLFYQKLTDIYATSVDYDKNAPTTLDFFKKVQNMMHYAVHQNTAAELIFKRADAKIPNMGLHSWENAPDGKIVKTDVSIAKNYLTPEEMESTGRLVSAFLDLAEDRATRHIPMTMENWAQNICKFLSFDERPILKNAGEISHEMAKLHAENEFEKFRPIQDKLFLSDFDQMFLDLKDE